jgi:hypothetical protein
MSRRTDRMDTKAKIRKHCQQVTKGTIRRARKRARNGSV